MSQFSPCLHCKRHVRIGDGACPFCGGAAPTRGRALSNTAGMKRAALFALGTSLAAACSDADEPGKVNSPATPTSATATSSAGGMSSTGATATATPSPSDTENTQPVYGSPVATSSQPSPQPLYGAIPVPSTSNGVPEVDAGDTDSGATDAGVGDGGDAASDDGGIVVDPSPTTVQALYGAPVAVYGAPVAPLNRNPGN